MKDISIFFWPDLASVCIQNVNFVAGNQSAHRAHILQPSVFMYRRICL